MVRYWRPTLAVVVALGVLLVATGGAQAIFIRGSAGPAGEVCSNAGGTLNGKFCVLEGGQSCEAMTLAIHNKCMDENGNVVDDGPDFGSNLPPEESEEGGED